MSLREVGRIAGILGAALTFIVGVISIVLGLSSSTPDQGGGSLVFRGLMLIGLSAAAGGGVYMVVRKPGRATLLFLVVAVLGSFVAFRSFWLAGAVLVIAAVLSALARDRR
jgi:hypothetical protein